MQYKITAQIPPLAAPGTRTSQVNRVFNAALGEFLDQHGGARYEEMYARYIGIAPRFRPRSSDCDPWVPAEEADDALKAVLRRGTLRFGFVAGVPYVYRDEGRLTGLDYEMGQALTEIISHHYHGAPHRLRAEWVELALPGDEQADKLAALAGGLAEGEFDIALSGQMMLPTSYLGGAKIEWTAPTAILFTAVSYTGRDDDKLDVKKMAALHSGDLPAFEAYAAAESQRLGLELRLFSVMNPGPSPGAATNLVYAIHTAGGRAVWDTGDISDSDTVMLTATDHFAVGDSLASGEQATRQGFGGIYLNIPATQELWPLAGFTAGPGDVAQPHFAVFAEHSDSKKPMAVDSTQPAQSSGWNVRVFNRTESSRGTSVQLEAGTGVVKLAAGRYHVTATSLVTYDDMAAFGKVTTDAEPYGGYCRLRRAEDVGCANEKALAVGTMSNANMVPSTIDAYLELAEETRLVLEHQVGANVDHLYLQGIWEKSSWHVFARIAIQTV
jgi:hypothetical protein